MQCQKNKRKYNVVFFIVSFIIDVETLATTMRAPPLPTTTSVRGRSSQEVQARARARGRGGGRGERGRLPNGDVVPRTLSPAASAVYSAAASRADTAACPMLVNNLPPH